MKQILSLIFALGFSAPSFGVDAEVQTMDYWYKTDLYHEINDLSPSFKNRHNIEVNGITFYGVRSKFLLDNFSYRHLYL